MNPLKVIGYGASMSVTQARELQYSLSTPGGDNELETRLRLVGYYFASAAREAADLRAAHVAWIVKTHPELDLGGYVALIEKNAPDAFALVKDAFRQAIAARPTDVALLSRAGRFLSLEAPESAEPILRNAIDLAPDDARLHDLLGLLLDFWADRSDAVIGRERRVDALSELELAVALHESVRRRFQLLIVIARLALQCGQETRAETAATQVIEDAPTLGDARLFWEGTHRSLIVLGTIALKRGDISSAVERLLAAGRVSCSVPIDSELPDWSLAKALAERGQFEAVRVYVTLCKRYMPFATTVLDAWLNELSNDSVPDFVIE